MVQRNLRKYIFGALQTLIVACEEAREFDLMQLGVLYCACIFVASGISPFMPAEPHSEPLSSRPRLSPLMPATKSYLSSRACRPYQEPQRQAMFHLSVAGHRSLLLPPNSPSPPLALCL